MPPAAIARALAFINKSVGGGFAKTGQAVEIGEVSVSIPGQGGLEGVVKVIVPLGVDAVATLGRSFDHTRVVEVAFRHEPGGAAEPFGLRVKDLGQLLENVS